MRRAVVLAVAAPVLLALLGSSCATAPPARRLTAPTAPATSTTTPPTTAATTTTTVPPTTAPPTTARPRPRPTTTVPPRVPDLSAYRGLGTWADVYDWSRSYTNGHPDVGPADVDAMAAAGVQTLFLQVSKADSPTDLVDPDLLLPIIARARLRHVRVVAWYLPTLQDPSADLRRLLAAARLGTDGLAVDIESRAVADVAERNRRLVALSGALRAALPGRPLGAIVLPPVVLEVVNPNYWPAFPWRALVPDYDVWLPMSYWTNRTAASGYRDAGRYTSENLARLRRDLGLPAAPVHTIGGIADEVEPADVAAMVQAAAGGAVLGGSLYDWHTTAASLWPGLAALRRS